MTASYASGAVTFTLAAGSEGQFEAGTGGRLLRAKRGSVSCPVPETPDSILLAGLAGDDVLSAPGLPEAVSVIALGNEGDDSLAGGETEDALVDGAGDDTVSGAGRDDALPNNGGADQLHAGAGEDLFISNAVCDGDSLDGGADRDNANWANFGSGVTIDMAQQVAGLIGPAGRGALPERRSTDEPAGDRGHRGHERRRQPRRRRRAQPVAPSVAPIGAVATVELLSASRAV